MKIIADLHIHSKYSRATSNRMDIPELSQYAKIKGINLLGSGDFTFPTWFNELKENLQPIEEGIFMHAGIMWMLTTEVNTIYEQENKQRKVHHIIHAPSFEIVEQINETLAKYGNLNIDGRPTLKLTSPELVENMMEISKEILIIPSHIWTSWFGALGEFSGFNSIKECYKNQTKHIHAIETGMSSDPEMNWRISELDKFTLVSNSDSHSAWPWRLGREANVFQLESPSYKKIINAIKNQDKKKLIYTIETPPPYGKYYLDGHRACEICLTPNETKKINEICPKCGRKLTIGVLHRIEELADRPKGFKPTNRIPFKNLIPLSELISSALGKDVYTKTVWQEYNKLIKEFGNEFRILLETPPEKLHKVTSEKLANAIILNREGKIKVKPGYDGKYGQIILEKEKQKTLF